MGKYCRECRSGKGYKVFFLWQINWSHRTIVDAEGLAESVGRPIEEAMADRKFAWLHEPTESYDGSDFERELRTREADDNFTWALMGILVSDRSVLGG